MAAITPDPQFDHFVRALEHVSKKRDIKVVIVYKPSVVLNVGGAATAGAILGGPLGAGIGAIVGLIADAVNRNEKVLSLWEAFQELAETAKENLFQFLRQLFRNFQQTVEDAFEAMLNVFNYYFDRIMEWIRNLFNSSSNGNNCSYQIAY